MTPSTNNDSGMPKEALRPEHIQPGTELELNLDKLALGGNAVGRAAGLVLFVERGLPGQRARVRVTQRKKRHAEAQLLEILRPGTRQTEPPCPHFAHCGGCDWQHLDYDAQLEWKRTITAEALQRIGGKEDVQVLPTLPSPQAFHYRNKMEFAYAGGGDSLALGLRKRASHEVLDLQTCLLPPQQVVEAVHVFRELCADSGLPAWDPETRQGFWRFLVLRAFETPPDGVQMLAELLTSPVAMWESAAREVAASAMLRLESLGLRGVVHGVRRSPSQIAQAQEWLHEEGDDTLEVSLQAAAGENGGQPGESLSYNVTAGAFFQTNTQAASHLAALVRDWAGVGPEDTVWDVYCGGGGPGLFLARQAGLLVGFDSSREAVADARDNARDNNLSNCVFRDGDVRHLLPQEREQPDVVLLDPPRSGLDKDVIAQLLQRAPRCIVSISCNPATQARDIGRLGCAYRLLKVQPVDLFPQTHHVESVALLQRR